MLNRTISISVASGTIFSFVTTFCSPLYATKSVIAQSLSAQNEISVSALEAKVREKGKSPEDVNSAMRDRFPKSSFPYYEPANGCSLPFDDDGWNEVFESACNNHDICYATPGSMQPVCDKKMSDEMTAICENVSLYRRITCPASANIYYKGIQLLGKKYHDAAQEQQEEYIKAVYNWLLRKWPDQYVGNWKGSGVQAGGGWSILINLNPGEKGSVVGTIDYPSIPCSGKLTLRGISEQFIELSENLTKVGTCVDNGIVSLQLNPDDRDRLQYKWYYSNGNLAATGSLQRVK
jgi:hypothetical protein